MAAQLINPRQKLMPQQLSRTLTLISSFDCRRLGSKSFAGKFLFNSLFPCLREVIYVYTWFSFLSWSVASHRQVDRDCDLLEHERIMDYSLLVGLHLWEALRTRTPSGIRTPTGYFLSLHSSLFPYILKLNTCWTNVVPLEPQYRKWRPWYWWSSPSSFWSRHG